MSRRLAAVGSLVVAVVVGLAALVACGKKESPVAGSSSPPVSSSSAPVPALSAVAPTTSATAPALPSPTVVAKGQNRPVAVAIASGSIYWVNYGVDEAGKQKAGLGSVQRASLGEGEVVTVAVKQDLPMHIAADATHVYWTDTTGVKRAPLGGGPTSSVTRIPTGQGVPSALAVDSGLALVGVFHLGDQGGLFRTPKTGGALKEVQGGMKRADAIASDGESTFVCLNGDVLGRIPKGGNAENAALLGKGLHECAGIAVDEDAVYFTEEKLYAGSLNRVSKSGGEVTVLARNLGKPHEVVVTGDSVYWLEWGEESLPPKPGRVARMSKKGGAVTTLVGGLKSPRGLAVAYGTAAWGIPDDGTVMKVVFDAEAAAKAPPAPAAVAPVPARHSAFPPGGCRTDADCPGKAWCVLGNCDYRGPMQAGQ